MYRAMIISVLIGITCAQITHVTPLPYSMAKPELTQNEVQHKNEQAVVNNPAYLLAQNNNPVHQQRNVDNEQYTMQYTMHSGYLDQTDSVSAKKLFQPFFECAIINSTPFVKSLIIHRPRLGISLLVFVLFSIFVILVCSRPPISTFLADKMKSFSMLESNDLFMSSDNLNLLSLIVGQAVDKFSAMQDTK